MSLLTQIDVAARFFGLTPKASRAKIPGFVRGIGRQTVFEGGVSTPNSLREQAAWYAKSPAFYASVNKIAEAGAMVDVAVFDGYGKRSKPIDDHPLLELLRRPAPFMEWLSLDYFTILESILASLGIFGNAFLYMGARENSRQPPGMLLPLRTDRVTPVVSEKRGVVIGYEISAGSKSWRIGVDDIIHFRRYNPFNEYMGLSSVYATHLALETDYDAQRHNRSLFKNGARLSIILESDERQVRQQDRELMEAYWREHYIGDPDKAGSVAFLWAGFKAKDLGMNQRDAEYIEGRKLNRGDVLMAMGVHPAMISAEDVNLANARVAEYLFSKYTLKPALTRIESRFNSELLPLYGENHVLRFLNVVPRDAQQATESHRTYLDRGVMTINEVRSEIGYGPVQWGDMTVAEYMTLVKGQFNPDVMTPNADMPTPDTPPTVDNRGRFRSSGEIGSEFEDI